jgi:glycosyltransferase involved in cell wall biosynthesis
MVSELSILIPVYNRSVIELVQALVQQAESLPIPVEIRVYDDGSSSTYTAQNHILNKTSPVVYKELPENLGRSQIRYLLAQEARYSKVLFLDNDVLPVHSDFLKTYLTQHAGNVTVGGISYQPDAPEPALRLRWLYGRNREEASVSDRKHTPYARIFLSNLMVEKDLFLRHFQKNAVKAYGHEDTLFAIQLHQHHIPVLHIDNPVEHLGLETAEVFLQKTTAALQNLVELQRTGKITAESKLLLWHHRLSKTGVMRILKSSEQWLLPVLEKNLTSNNPSLKAFDLYRLVRLAQFMQS